MSTATPETVGEVGEFHGPHHLAGAVRFLMHEEVDLVVVRQLVTDADFIDRIAANATDYRFIPKLYRHIPQLRQVDGLAERFWAEHGYTDYGFKGRKEPHLHTYHRLSDKGATMHVDFVKDFQSGYRKVLGGPLAISIGLSGSAVFAGQRQPTTFHGADGSFDVAACIATCESTVLPETLRSSVRQEQGDAVIVLNQPYATIHQVENNPGRIAALFDYHVEKN
jgi:hypothetical protein